MYLRKLRSRGRQNGRDSEATLNVPRDILDIEGLIDDNGEIEEANVGILYDPQESKIEILIDPQDELPESNEQPVMADGSG